MGYYVRKLNSKIPESGCPVAVYALSHHALKSFTLLMHAGAVLHLEDLTQHIPETDYQTTFATLQSLNAETIRPGHDKISTLEITDSIDS